MRKENIELLRPFLRRSGFKLERQHKIRVGQYSTLICGDELIIECYWSRFVTISQNGFLPTENWEPGGNFKIEDWSIGYHGDNYVVVTGKDGDTLTLYNK